MTTSAQIHLVATCSDCKLKHEIRVTPAAFLGEMDTWNQKHPGHQIEFVSPKRFIPKKFDDSTFDEIGKAPWWLEHAEFKPNANIKLAWSSSVAMTFTSLNSLSSSTLSGASALAVDNTSNLYLDYLLSGFVKNNTSSAPTAGTSIDVWLYRSFDDTPTYPDTLAGTDATKTITTINILNSSCKLAASMAVAATTSQVNAFDAGAISGFFNGVTPKLWSVFVLQNSGQTLASSGNTLSYQASYLTSI